MKVVSCMNPVLSACPGSKQDCIIRHISGLCPCQGDVDTVVAQCPEVSASMASMQTMLPKLCNGCMPHMVDLYKNKETCLQGTGKTKTVNKETACGATCRPIFCSILSTCTAGSTPGSSAGDLANIRGNVT